MVVAVTARGYQSRVAHPADRGVGSGGIHSEQTVRERGPDLLPGQSSRQIQDIGIRERGEHIQLRVRRYAHGRSAREANMLAGTLFLFRHGDEDAQLE